MRKLIIIVLTTLFSLSSFSQSQDRIVESDTTVYLFVDSMSEIDSLYSIIVKEYRYATCSREHMKGAAYVQFIIEKSGMISNVNIMRSISEYHNKEIMRVMKLCPKLKPGKKNGNPVRVKMTLPINFSLRK